MSDGKLNNKPKLKTDTLKNFFLLNIKETKCSETLRHTRLSPKKLQKVDKKKESFNVSYSLPKFKHLKVSRFEQQDPTYVFYAALHLKIGDLIRTVFIVN